MNEIKIIISGFAVGFLSALPVSTSALEIIRRGILYGFWASVLVALGTITSDLFYSVLAYFGLNKYILGNVIIRDVSGIVAAVIIAIIGIYILFEARKDRQLTLEKMEKDEIQPYFTGILITIFNPFVLFFWASVLNIALSSNMINGNKNLGGLFLISALVGISVWTFSLARLSSLGKIKFNSKVRKYSNVIIGGVLLLSSIVIIIRVFTMN